MSFRDPQTVRRVLDMKTWAIVGLTGNPHRAAYGVAQFLLHKGRTIVPVNPDAADVLGEQGYARLADIPFTVDVVDIFRRSDKAGVHVDEAIDVRARAVWLQLGVVDEDAAARAELAGLDVVMDACPKLEWP
jgi:predicted CoA-binding protein